MIVTCSGEGKAKRPGELTITIHNHNSVSLTNLCLYIDQLNDFKTGKMLDITIKPNDQVTHEISISEYPELAPNKNENKIELSGQLTFSFSNTDSSQSNLDSQSYIIIKQIFSSGIQGGLDDFL